jgi:hypothetical protein
VKHFGLYAAVSGTGRTTFHDRSVALNVALFRAEVSGHRHAAWWLGRTGDGIERWGVFRLRAEVGAR